jgi:hypothetical protein
VKEQEGLGMESLAEHYKSGCWALMAIEQVLDVEPVLEEQRVAIRLEPVKKVGGCSSAFWFGY